MRTLIHQMNVQIKHCSKTKYYRESLPVKQGANQNLPISKLYQWEALEAKTNNPKFEKTLVNK